MADLNERQKEFARLLAKGVAQDKAYREAFDCKGKKDATVRSAACRLAKNVNISQHVASLSQQADRAAILTREERMQMLTRNASRCDEAGHVGDMVKCLAELNKMDGAYEPEKVEVTVDACSVAAVLAEVLDG